MTRARQDARSFQEAVLGAVARVPAGRVATYGDIAALAGRARAARAVGGILAASTRPGLPYHRVVAAGGHLGGFGSGPAFKAALLLAEGLVVRRGRIQGFERHRWPARNALGRRSV